MRVRQLALLPDERRVVHILRNIRDPSFKTWDVLIVLGSVVVGEYGAQEIERLNFPLHNCSGGIGTGAQSYCLALRKRGPVFSTNRADLKWLLQPLKRIGTESVLTGQRSRVSRHIIAMAERWRHPGPRHGGWDPEQRGRPMESKCHPSCHI